MYCTFKCTMCIFVCLFFLQILTYSDILCMFVYIHVCVYVCIHHFLHLHTCSCTALSIHIHVHLSIYVYASVQGHHPSRRPGLARVRQGDYSVRLELGHIYVVGLYAYTSQYAYICSYRSVYILAIPICVCACSMLILLSFYTALYHYKRTRFIYIAAHIIQPVPNNRFRSRLTMITQLNPGTCILYTSIIQL